MRTFIFLVLLAQPYVMSQVPAPTPTKASENKQREGKAKQPKTPSNQQLADALAVTNDKLASEIAAREKQASTTPQTNKPPSEWWISSSVVITALATVAIAILAYFQWSAIDRQATDMRTAFAETTKAADAAQKSADALIASERAWLIPDNFVTHETAHFLRLKNWGRTPAHVKEIRCAYVATLAEDVWPINYASVHELVCPPEPVAPGAVTDLYSVGLVLEPADGPKRRHVFGIVRYTDIGEDERTITFYLSLNDPPPKWVRSGPPEANRYT